VVPVMLGLAYVGMAYLSWTLSRVISGSTRNSLRGSQFIAVLSWFSGKWRSSVPG
jgi:hypothetical protein